MKVTVYRGTLHAISEGEVTRGRSVTHTSTNIGGAVVGGVLVGSASTRTKEIYQRDRQEGMIRRASVTVGDVTIKNLYVHPMHDQVLLDAVGQDVALSVTGRPNKRRERQIVVAAYTPASGLVRPPLAQLLVVAIWVIIKGLIGAVIVGGIATFILWLIFVLIGKVIGMQTAGAFVGLGLGALVFVRLLLEPFMSLYATFRARGALDIHGDAPYKTA